MNFLIAAAILVACYFIWGWLAVLIAAILLIMIPAAVAVGLFGFLSRKESHRKRTSRW